MTIEVLKRETLDEIKNLAKSAVDFHVEKTPDWPYGWVKKKMKRLLENVGRVDCFEIDLSSETLESLKVSEEEAAIENYMKRLFLYTNLGNLLILLVYGPVAEANGRHPNVDRLIELLRDVDPSPEKTGIEDESGQYATISEKFNRLHFNTPAAT